MELVQHTLTVIFKDKPDVSSYHVIFHNGSNYDFHILIRELIYHKEHNILPIAKSAYNFIKFDWGMFRFIDSRRFLKSVQKRN